MQNCLTYFISFMLIIWTKVSFWEASWDHRLSSSSSFFLWLLQEVLCKLPERKPQCVFACVCLQPRLHCLSTEVAAAINTLKKLLSFTVRDGFVTFNFWQEFMNCKPTTHCLGCSQLCLFWQIKCEADFCGFCTRWFRPQTSGCRFGFCWEVDAHY